jgi:hypothetical protein
MSFYGGEMKNKQDEKVQVMCEIGRSSVKAQQIIVPHKAGKRAVWIPLSQVHSIGDDRIFITPWIAKQTDLLKGEY